MSQGRKKVVPELIRFLKERGHTVLSEHLGEDYPFGAQAKKMGLKEEELTPDLLWYQDVAWIEEADCMIAEVSVPGSDGRGGEIQHFCSREGLGLSLAPLLMIHEEGEGNPSAAIQSRPLKNSLFHLKGYKDLEEAKQIILKFLRESNLE